MQPSAKACVLVSGGLDSAVLLDHCLRRHRFVQPLYIRFGLSWEKAELHWLRKYLIAVKAKGLLPLRLIDLPARDVYGNHWSFTRRRVPGYRSLDKTVYLPGRNILLLSKASVFCSENRIPFIYVGTLKGNPFRDSSPTFRQLMEKALGLGLGVPLKILAPFSQSSKNDVLRAGLSLPLHLTFSCLSPKGLRPCGRCNKCAERDRVLKGLDEASRRTRKNLLS